MDVFFLTLIKYVVTVQVLLSQLVCKELAFVSVGVATSVRDCGS